MAPVSPKVLFGHHAISERDHRNNTTLLISGKRKIMGLCPAIQVVGDERGNIVPGHILHGSVN